MGNALAGFGMAAVFLGIIAFCAIDIHQRQKDLIRRRRELQERREAHEKRMAEARKAGWIE